MSPVQFAYADNFKVGGRGRNSRLLEVIFTRVKNYFVALLVG